MLLRKIKHLLGIDDSLTEYWIYTKDIQIPNYFRRHKIGQDKFEHKFRHFNKYGKFQSIIILDDKFNLIDGYSSIKIANIIGIDKVPVFFAKDKNDAKRIKSIIQKDTYDRKLNYKKNNNSNEDIKKGIINESKENESE